MSVKGPKQLTCRMHHGSLAMGDKVQSPQLPKAVRRDLAGRSVRILTVGIHG
jgi:hypothetical protein